MANPTMARTRYSSFSILVAETSACQISNFTKLHFHCTVIKVCPFPYVLTPSLAPTRFLPVYFRRQGVCESAAPSHHKREPTIGSGFLSVRPLWADCCCSKVGLRSRTGFQYTATTFIPFQFSGKE